MRREQRASRARRHATQGNGFEKLARGRFEDDRNEPAAQLDVDFNPGAVRFEEHLPALLRTEGSRDCARTFDEIGRFRASGIDQPQISERGLRGVESLWRQRNPHQAGRSHIEALTKWPVIQRSSLSMADAEESQSEWQKKFSHGGGGFFGLPASVERNFW